MDRAPGNQGILGHRFHALQMPDRSDVTTSSDDSLLMERSRPRRNRPRPDPIDSSAGSYRALVADDDFDRGIGPVGKE